MTQIITATEQTLLRTHAQTTKLGLAIAIPAEIFRAEVHSTGDGSPGLLIQNESGDKTQMEFNFLVTAGSAPGLRDGGKVRFKSSGAQTITVNLNHIQWSVFPHVTGYRLIEPTVILPDNENDFEDDNTAYDGVSNKQYHPLGRIGPPAFGLTGQPVSFYSTSQPIASGASIVAHNWTFPNGSPSTSTLPGSAAAPIDVTWASPTGHGFEYIKYTTTDSNGRTHDRYNPVWVFDSLPDLYCDLEVETLEIDWSTGHANLSLNVRDAGDANLWPQDAMVCIFAEDWHGSTMQSIGGNWEHRENLVFCGYLVEDSVQINHENSSVSFDAIGIMGIAGQLLSWPKNLTDDGDPDQWSQLSGMTTGRTAFYVLTQRTTIHNIHDINYDTGISLQAVDIPETNVAAQLNEYALSSNRSMKAVSDMQGSVYFSPEINVMDEAARDSIPQTIELEFNDMRDDPGLNLAVEEHNTAVSQIDFVGFGYDGQDATPWYSLAPSKQLPHGTVEKVDGIRVNTQEEANIVSGYYLGDRNNIFRENTVPLFNWRIFDIAPVQYGLLSLTGFDNPRGIVWTQQRLIPRNISYSFDPELLRLEADVTFEKDTIGPPGVPGFYPSQPPPPGPPKPPDQQLPTNTIIVWDFLKGTWRRNSWLQIDGGTTGDDNLDVSGDIDPYWVQRQGTSFPGALVAFKTVKGKVWRTFNGGTSWTNVSPSDRFQTPPPNDWLALPPPVFDDFDITDFRGSLGVQDMFAMAGNFEFQVDTWIAFVGITKRIASPGTLTWQWASVRRWWLGDNTDTGAVQGAYRAVAATDKAESLTNRPSPGTDDAVESGVVTWTRLTGWDFSGGTTYIDIPYGLSNAGEISVVIAFKDMTAGWIFGTSEAGAEFGAFVSGSDIVIQKGALSHTVVGVTSGTIAIVRRATDEALYFDGVEVLTGAIQTLSPTFIRMFVGAANTTGGAASHSDGTVQAVSVYNATMTDEQAKAASSKTGGLRPG